MTRGGLLQVVGAFLKKESLSVSSVGGLGVIGNNLSHIFNGINLSRAVNFYKLSN